MLNFNQITLGNVVVHRVGNHSQEEGVSFSQNYLSLNNELTTQLMLKYFLSPFKTPVYYHLMREVMENDIFVAASKVFDNSEDLFNQSIILAKQLYAHSTHPKIKGGEFYIVYMKDCLFEDEMCDGIGLFKTEHKEAFLKVNRKEGEFEINNDEGINISKLDKGCIILNTERETGYIVAVFDKISDYWKKEFLQVTPRRDDFYKTKNAMNFCKSFIEDFSKIDNLSGAEQADIKNKTLKYFSENTTFNQDEFADVLETANVNKYSFDEYKRNYEVENNVEIENNFEIAETAVTTQKKFFKAVLKLDKNFHVYIHGDRELVEKGFDEETGKSYYKLFFDNEE